MEHPIISNIVAEADCDALVWQILTNDIYKSVEHRVVVNGQRSRYSVATFYDPAKTVLIKPAEPLVTKDRPAQFPSILYGDHVAMWYSKGPDGKKTIDSLVIEWWIAISIIIYWRKMSAPSVYVVICSPLIHNVWIFHLLRTWFHLRPSSLSTFHALGSFSSTWHRTQTCIHNEKYQSRWIGHYCTSMQDLSVTVRAHSHFTLSIQVGNLQSQFHLFIF